MKDTAYDAETLDSLKTALQVEKLPAAAREYGTSLLRRLVSPVRVSVLGRPGAGKSELVNMFCRERVIPKDSRFPTTEIAYGGTKRIIATGLDGKQREIDEATLPEISTKNAAFLRIETPAKPLRRISLLEIVTDGTLPELAAAVDWVVKRTDIALWCTQGFEEDERALWSRVPDALKDHAFLVLTKADRLSAERKLSRRVSDLENVVAEEFHSLFAVATMQALGAFSGGGKVDEAIYHSSGGGALVSEVIRHAERGRRADFDSAALFLARYKKRPQSRPRPEPGEMPKADEAMEASVPGTQASLPAKAAPLETDAPPVEVKTQKTPPEAPLPLEPEPLAEDARKVFVDAVRFLRRRGESLADQMDKIEAGETGAVTEQCLDALEHLTDIFSSDDSGEDAVDETLDDVAEANDMVVLMQVEDGDAPAADAVTLLLQLRREMETRLAA